MVAFQGSFTSSLFRRVQPGEIFFDPSGEFAADLCLQSPLDRATLYLKRSDTVVIAFCRQGIQSFPIGSDYGDIDVILVPLPQLVRTTDEDLQQALGMLTQPYG